MAETNYVRLVGTANEAAEAQGAREEWARRMLAGVRPPGGVSRPGGRQTGELPAALANFFIPQTPLDVAMYALGGPFSRAVKVGEIGRASRRERVCIWVRGGR